MEAERKRMNSILKKMGVKKPDRLSDERALQKIQRGIEKGNLPVDITIKEGELLISKGLIKPAQEEAETEIPETVEVAAESDDEVESEIPEEVEAEIEEMPVAEAEVEEKESDPSGWARTEGTAEGVDEEEEPPAPEVGKQSWGKITGLKAFKQAFEENTAWLRPALCKRVAELSGVREYSVANYISQAKKGNVEGLLIHEIVNGEGEKVLVSKDAEIEDEYASPKKPGPKSKKKGKTSKKKKTVTA